MDITSESSYAASILYRHLNHEYFDSFLTLSTDRQGFPLRVLQKNIQILFCMIEKKMVGSRFNKKTFEERIQFIGFPEHINDDFNIPHYHLLVKFPDNIKKKYPLRHKQIFKDNLYNSWRKFVEPTYKKIKPDGSSRTILDCYKINRYCDVRRIRSKRAVDYVTKDLGRVYSDNEEHIIFNETPFK